MSLLVIGYLIGIIVFGSCYYLDNKKVPRHNVFQSAFVNGVLWPALAIIGAIINLYYIIRSTMR